MHLSSALILTMALALSGSLCRAASSLPVLSPVRLGAAASLASAPCEVQRLASGGWRVLWTDPAGRRVQSHAPASATGWSAAAPIEFAADDSIAAEPRTESATWTVRNAMRVPGRVPHFPSAPLVVTCVSDEGATDYALVDELAGSEIGGLSQFASEGLLVAAYIKATSATEFECRVVVCPTAIDALPASAAGTWTRLPDYPEKLGQGGILVGTHAGVLIAAGGANFPEGPPWEGGRKAYADTIYVLQPGATDWIPAGHLPAQRAYSAMVSTPEGVWVIGGENAGTVFADVLFLRWTGQSVEITSASSLPSPITNAAAVCAGPYIYVAGGYAGSPRLSRDSFWRLDRTKPDQGWTVLPTWPGPARGQSVLAAAGEELFLFSGIELPAPQSSAKARYLRDAYSYAESRGWQTLPPPPWSAIAAPTPAPLTRSGQILLLGGVDGEQVGHLPRDSRLPDDILEFDPTARTWRLVPQGWPRPVVTIPAVRWDERWIFVSGEVAAGVRTPEVWAWTPPH